MGLSLYELTTNYKNLVELLDDENVPNDVLEQGMASIGDDIEVKAENYAKIIKNFEGEAETIDKEIKRLTSLKRVKKNRVLSLKANLYDGLKAVGMKKIKGALFTISIGKNPSSLDVIDEKLIPTEYFIPQKPILDKKLLLDDLKAKIEVAGASIKQGESLRIK